MVQKKMQARERVEQVFISAAKSLLIWDFVGWSRAGCVCPGARLPLVPTAAPSDLTWFSFTPASGVSVSLTNDAKHEGDSPSAVLAQSEQQLCT